MPGPPRAAAADARQRVAGSGSRVAAAAVACRFALAALAGAAPAARAARPLDTVGERTGLAGRLHVTRAGLQCTLFPRVTLDGAVGRRSLAGGGGASFEVLGVTMVTRADP